MLSSYEYRLRARASLGGSIFGNIWLLSVLALVIVSAVTSLVSFTFVGPLLVTGALSLGTASIFLRLARGKGAVDLTDLMKGFVIDYVGNLLLGILSGLFIALWSLLLFIPGIMKAYAYSMIYFVKDDNPQYTWRQCLDESERIMAGKKWRLFCLDFSFIGWIILGSIPCGIGLLWVVPYIQAAHAQFYETARR